jgi:hypothetical protein
MRTVTSSIPRPAAWLGFGGLIPFAGLTAALLLDPADAARWTFALIAYGAIILSFVGALHWSFATLWQSHPTGCRGRMMAWSVIHAPSAGITLLTPAQAGLGLLCALFVAHHLSDLHLARNHEIPAWYPRLRTPLTLGAVASLATATFTL